MEEDEIKEVKNKISNVEIYSVATQCVTVLIHPDTVGHMERDPTTVLIVDIPYLATTVMQIFRTALMDTVIIVLQLITLLTKMLQTT